MDLTLSDAEREGFLGDPDSLRKVAGRRQLWVPGPTHLDMLHFVDYRYTLTRTGETWLASFSAEESDFVRFNRSVVRQAGSVKQIGLTISLIAQQRRAELRLTLSGQQDNDYAHVRAALETLRHDLGDLSEDPFLLYNQRPQSTERISDSKLASNAEVLDQIMSDFREV